MSRASEPLAAARVAAAGAAATAAGAAATARRTAMGCSTRSSIVVVGWVAGPVAAINADKLGFF